MIGNQRSLTNARASDARGGDAVAQMVPLVEGMAERRCSVRQIVQAVREFGRESANGVVKAPDEREGDNAFLAFWHAFPARDGDNPQAPAIVAWRRALAAGGDPERIIAAERAYAAAVSGREKRFICSAARWLAEGRWLDERAVSGPSNAVGQPGVWIAHDSPQWRAWASHWRETKGKSPPMDSKGGWRFPAPWPPAADEGAAA